MLSPRLVPMMKLGIAGVMIFVFASACGGTDWSSSDLNAVISYCQAVEVPEHQPALSRSIRSCGTLGSVLRDQGCTVEDAYRFMDSLMRPRSFEPLKGVVDPSWIGSDVATWCQFSGS